MTVDTVDDSKKGSTKDSAPNAPASANVDASEVDKFDALAARWWDKEGEFRPLHDLNPTRADYVAACCGFDATADSNRSDPTGLRGLDVGCGGGILTEELARRGVDMLGIDMAPGPLAVARLHALETGVSVRYEQTTAEDLAAATAEPYDFVTCLEMLEHVPDVDSVIRACAQLVRPGGELIFSTINRTPKAYALAVVGAEYVMNLLPRGTHDYARFIRPAELARAVRNAGLVVRDISGLSYNPFSRRCTLTRDTGVNYLLHAHKPATQNSATQAKESAAQ